MPSHSFVSACGAAVIVLNLHVMHVGLYPPTTENGGGAEGFGWLYIYIILSIRVASFLRQP